MSVPYGLFLLLLSVQLSVSLFKQLLNHIKHPAKYQHEQNKNLKYPVKITKFLVGFLFQRELAHLSRRKVILTERGII
jgi:hypothetical protein